MRITIFAAVVAAHIALVWYFLTLWHVAALEETDESSMTLVFLPPAEPVTTAGAASAPTPSASAASRESWQAPLLYRNAPVVSRGAVPSARPGVSAELSPLHETLEHFESAPGATSEPPGSAVPSAEEEGHRSGASVPSATAKAASAETSAPGSTAQVASTETSASGTTAQAASTGTSTWSTTPDVDWRTQAEITAQADAQRIVESEDRATRQAGALTAMIKPNHPGPHNPAVPFPWDPSPRYRWQPAGGGGFQMALNDHCELFFAFMLFVGCTVGELPPARGDLFKNMHPPVKFGDWDWRLDDP